MKSEKSLFKKMQSDTIDFDILYYNLIGYLGVERTKEFLKDYYNMKEELKQIANRKGFSVTEDEYEE